jgi:putative Mg2+ transporter-C (MgtC) family protein
MLLNSTRRFWSSIDTGVSDSRKTLVVALFLPLGILTGVGFIGGGAILRRGDLGTGATTAATLWVVTVIGLCLGGDQQGLGVAATLFGVITLWTLKWLYMRIPREHRAMLVIRADLGSSPFSSLPDLIAPLGYKALFDKRNQTEDTKHVALGFEVGWKRAELAVPPLDLVKLVNEHYSVVSFALTSEAPH